MTERDDRDDARFAAWARARLDERADALDGATRSRLARARAAAVERAVTGSGSRLSRLLRGGSASWFGTGRTIPAGALASVAVAVFAAALIATDATRVERTPLDDLEVLTTEADLDLLQDLEFYEWLEQQEAAG